MGSLGSKISKESKKSIMKDYKNPINAKTRLKNLEIDQQEFLTFNVGGELFKISKYVIMESPYKSYFKECLKTNENEIFLDRSIENFSLIIQILRTSPLIKEFTKNYGPTNYFSSIKNKIKNSEYFKADLKFFFPKDYEKILKDYDLAKTLEIPNSNNLIESYELLKEEKDEVLFYMQYKAKDIKELFNLYNRKGMFMQPEGGLVIKLSSIIQIKRIEMRPFIFDKQYWDSEVCKRVSLSIKSGNNEQWCLLDIFDLYLDEEDIATLDFKEVKVKEIKISTESLGTPISFSYLKIY